MEIINRINTSSRSYLKRQSLFNNESLLVLFAFLLFSQIEVYLSLLKTSSLVIENSIGYVIVFIILLVVYFPKKINRIQVAIIISTAIIIRLKLLFILPIVSTDLQRNLIFGSLFQGGWNPYQWTIVQIPELFKQGFVPKVNFTLQWFDHSYDYPILAVSFFAFITSFVPADNYSAYILAKLFLIGFDSLNAFLIYRIVYEHFNNKELGRKIGLLYLLNPLSVFLVGLEGQFEPIPLFFVLLTFYFLFYSKKELRIKNYDFNASIPYITGFLLACGFLFKYFPIFYVPAIFFFFGKQYKKSINFFLTFICSIIFLSLPVLVNSFYISNFLLFQLNRKTNWFNGVTYPLLGFDIPLLLIFMAMLASSFLFFYFKQDKLAKTATIGTLSMYIFVYFNPSMYSWYILWFYGSMLFIGIRNKDHLPSLYDDMLPSLYWVMSLSVLVAIWDPEQISFLLLMIISSYIFTLSILREHIKLLLNKILKVLPLNSDKKRSMLRKDVI